MTTIIIFGATGDLTARKLAPSLYRLAKKGRLPDDVKIVGAARTPLSDDAFRDRLAAAVKEFAKDDWDEAKWRDFARRLYYVPGDAAKPGGLDGLKAWLEKAEGGRGGRRLFYLAVAPTLYADIVRQLAAEGLNRQDGANWTRLVIEKPFGRDVASARELNRVLRGAFAEEQIYRIDHYLGKDTVQNVLVFRFANTLFEPVWNFNFIDHVQITVSRDGQDGGPRRLLRQVRRPPRHVPEPPVAAVDADGDGGAGPIPGRPAAQRKGQGAGRRARPDAGRGRQANGRRPVRRLPLRKGRRRGFQHAHLRGDRADRRELALAERAVLSALRQGDERRRSEIVVQFRCPPHLMFPLPPGATLQCNRLTMTIQPDEGIDLNFQSKAPDDGTVALRPTDLRFRYKEAYPDAPLPESYERLLMDALAGDAHLFMRSDEIERAWEIMDPFIAAVESGAVRPQEYPVSSEGPCCGDDFLAPMGRAWLPLGREK